MSEIGLWKLFVSLGIPGLALGIFYMLFRKFNWQFPIVPKKYVGPIIILFMITTAVIILYVLTLWSPERRATYSSHVEADPVPIINDYFKELVKQDIRLDSLKNNNTVLYVMASAQSVCKNTQDVDRAISALRSYTLPNNPAIFRLVAVQILANLSREKANGEMVDAKIGFLSELDLSELDLQQCDFSYADLRKSKFRDTNLGMCRFDNTNFSSASFLRTILDNTLIGQSNFQNASLKDCTFYKAILAESNMRDAHFEHCSFSNATLFGLNLQGSYFLQPSFENTNIMAVDFRDALFVEGIRVQNTLCDRGMGIDFSSSHFAWKTTLKSGERLHTTFFPSLNEFTFEFPREAITDFSGAILDFVDFSKTLLQDVKFANSQLYGAKFDRATISNVDFNGANLECASFNDTNIFSGSIEQAKSLAYASFQGAIVSKNLLKPLQEKGVIGANVKPRNVLVHESIELKDATVKSPQPSVKDADKWKTVIDLGPVKN